MAVSEVNRLRHRARLISREVKALFCAIPEWLKIKRPRWFYRWLFLGPDEKPHRVGEVVLADLREFAFVGRNVFDTDPLVMARRLGRQEVAMRIINYLNLDEAVVQKLMELDDGL